MALLLLKRGANVNCKDDHSGTPLHYAVLRGHADLTGLLISWKADIEVRNIHGMDSLHLAAFDSEPYCLQLLSLSGGNLMTQTSHDPGDLLIHTAVKQKHENVIRWLIEHGMPVDVPNRIGVTALIYASELGLYNVARLLINNGANVNVRFSSHDNSTPLHLTCAGGNKELAKLLIENGADINARTSSDGRTPLHWAVESQHHALIQLLIRYGPDLRVKDSLGYTAARLAECKCYYPIFNFLKEVEDEITPLS
jgi:ankyrin repeat protein